MSTTALQKIKSKYTQRIFELILASKHHLRSEGCIRISLEEFTDILQIKDSKKEYKYLKRDILLHSFKELFERELIYAIVKEEKQGKSVKNILIYFKNIDVQTWENITLQKLQYTDMVGIISWGLYPELNEIYRKEAALKRIELDMKLKQKGA
jgi:plasmid replication initiation protein